jgi:hypothetical protein
MTPQASHYRPGPSADHRSRFVFHSIQERSPMSNPSGQAETEPAAQIDFAPRTSVEQVYGDAPNPTVL